MKERKQKTLAKRLLVAMLSVMMTVTFIPTSLFAYAAEPEVAPDDVQNDVQTEVVQDEPTEATEAVQKDEPQTEATEATKAKTTKEDTTNDENASDDEIASEDDADAEFTGGELKQESDLYKVTVSYDADAMIPDDADLFITEFSQKDKEYKDAKQALVDDEDGNSPFSQTTKEEQEGLGLAAFDLTIRDKDGNVVEPESKVSVSVEFKELPEGVAAEDLAASMEIQHLNESTGDVVVEKVATVDSKEAAKDKDLGEIDVKEKKETALAEFTVDSFSSYTVTWNQRTVNVKYVDENNNELTISNADSTYGNLNTTSHDTAYLIYDIEGYEYLRTDRVQSNGTRTEIRPELHRDYYNRAYHWEYTTTTGTGNATWNELSNGDTINVVYKKKPANTEGGSPTLKPVGSQDKPAAPTILKESKPNGDGTADLSLSIVGHTKDREVEKLADVIVIMDVSGSMQRELGNENNGTSKYDSRTGRWTGTCRLDNAKNAVNDLADELAQRKDSEGNPLVRMSLIDFSNNASEVIGLTDLNTQGVASYKNAVNGLSADGGTNWEQALRLANQQSVDTGRATFIIFVTDGDPTFRLTRYDVANNGFNNDISEGYYRAYGVFGAGSSDNHSYNYNAAVAEGLDITGANKNLYTIGISNNVTKVSNFNNDVNGNGAYLASDTSGLEQAFTDIQNSIAAMMGVSDIQMTDGITEMTQTIEKSGLTGTDGDFTYWKKAKGATSFVEWDPASENCLEAEYDEDSGAVEWNMGINFMPEDGATYKVTWKVWPSQKAYDILAKCKNDPSFYDTLTDAEQAQIDRTGSAPNYSYTLRTNEPGAGIVYKDATKTAKEITTEGDYISLPFNEVPDLGLASDHISIKKNWENDLDGRDPGAEPIVFTVKADDETFGTVTLGPNSDPDKAWRVDNYNISTGLMTTTGGKQVVYEHGHDYQIVEPDNLAYYWDFHSDIYHPMVIDNVTTMLLEVDTQEEADYTIDGKYYKVAGSDAVLEATNYRRSNVNLSKTVVDARGEAVSDQSGEFTFKVKVTESKNENVWFSVYDSIAGATVKDQSIATAEGIVYQESDGYFHVPSGTEVTLKLKNGWNCRFINLHTDSEYSFEETGMTNGYEFVNATSSVNQGSQGTPASVNNKKATGTVDKTNTSYSVNYNNKQTKINKTVKKEWDQNVDRGKLGITSVTVKLIQKLGDQVIREIEQNLSDANNWTYTFEDLLVAAEDGAQYTYKIVETAVNGKIDNVDANLISLFDVKTEEEGNNTTITNKYNAEPITVNFPVKKIVSVPEGMDGPANWSYTINVAANNNAPVAASMTGTVTKENPTTTFGPFTYDAPGTYTYTVSEIGTVAGVTNDAQAAGKTVTVEVTIGNNGKLTADVSSTTDKPLTFTNTYDVRPITASFPVKKIVSVPEGMDGPASWSYTIDVAGTPAAATMTGTVTKDNPTKIFGPFTYNAPGTYTYTVSETGTVAGVTNDKDAAGKTVTVTVVDNRNGTLTATASSTNNEPLTFTNAYNASGNTVIDGVKMIQNRNFKEGDKWTFTISAAEGTPLPEEKSVTIEPTSGTSAEFSFDKINYTQADVGKTYTYTITETGEVAGVKNSAAQTVTVTISDNGDGSLNVVKNYGEGKTRAEFINVYSADGETNLDGVKTIENRHFKEGDEWTFTVTAATGTPMPERTEVTVAPTSGSEVAVDFGKIEYTEADIGKEYVYTITESGVVDGVVNDSAKTVKVTVSDNGDGTLKVEKSYGAGAKALAFNNVYEATGNYPLKAVKTLSGRDFQKGDTFTFNLTTSEGAPLPKDAEGNEVTSVTVEPTSSNSVEVDFGSIDFDLSDKDKTYTYTIQEVKGNIGGITYDVAKYTVELTVHLNEKTGEIYATPQEGYTGITIRNTYKPAETTAPIVAKKELSGRALKAEEFEFTLKEAKEGGQTYTEKNDADGKVDFGTFTYEEAGTYNYTITENAGSLGGVTYDESTYDVTVEVVDNLDGTMSATVSYAKDGEEADAAVFKNKYEAEGGIVLTAKKELEGRDLKAGEFEFQLLDADDNVLQTKENAADGTVTFDKITYTEKDMSKSPITYTIKEVKGNKAYFTYDEHPEEVKVTLTDDGKGNITAVADKSGENAATFKNTYTATGSLKLDGTKTLKNKDLEADKYTFTLEGTDGTKQTVKNKADGSFAFEDIQYTLADLAKSPITYTVKETKGNDGGITYDTTVYTVKATLTDDEKGNIVVTTEPETPKLDFVNTYNASGEATLEVEKTLTGKKIVAGQFTFNLIEITKGEDGEDVETVLQTQTNAANGKVTFDPIEYAVNDDKNDVGEHKYKIVEVGEAPTAYSYDDKVVNATVTVTDNGEGKLLTEVAYDDEEAFINTYEATGSTQFVVNKELKGRKLAAGQFTFELKNEKGETIQTKTNDENGIVTFDRIDYTQADLNQDEEETVIKYTITETNDKKPGYTYDDHTVDVTVTLKDDAAGNITADTKYSSGGLFTPNTVLFTNTYAATGETTLTAKKVLEGRDLEEGEFTFELKDSTGKVLQTKENAADGTVTFDALKYNESDVDPATHEGSVTYTISEVAGDEEYFGFDTEAEKITVTLKDNGDGTITAKPDKTGAAVEFDNTYEASGEIVLKATKELEGTDLKAGKFTFHVLDKDGKVVAEATNDKDGNVVFPAIEYDQDDVDPTTHTATVKYTVAEVIPEDADNNKKDGYTYDSNTFEVTVTLTDNKQGVITAEADKSEKDLTFTNTYEATGELDFSGLKTLERGDLADKEFSFELVQVEKKFIVLEKEELIEKVKVGGEDYDSEGVSPGEDTSAEFSFETITFTKDKDGDDCGEYIYRIREVVPDDAVAQFTDEAGKVTAVKYKDATDEQKKDGKFILGNYQYDSAVHEIKVTVTDNGDGTLEVTKEPAATGDYDAEFTNVKAFTELEITKDLRAFVDTNAEEITLAFEITGKTPEDKDYRAAAGLTFTKEEVLAGKLKTVKVEKVPTGTMITVKEVYASNFEPDANPQTAELNKDGIYTVKFVDTYNNITYNTGAINKYTKNDKGGYDPPGKQASSEDSPGDQAEE